MLHDVRLKIMLKWDKFKFTRDQVTFFLIDD